MADYTIWNASGAVIEEINAGEDDLAVGLNEGVSLDDDELAALLLAEAEIAVFADAADLGDFGTLADEVVGDTTVDVITASGTTESEANSVSDILTALAAGGVIVLSSVSDEAKRKLAKVLTHGELPGEVT